MIELNGYSYKDWKDYFSSTFLRAKTYERVDEGIHGDTKCEKYVPIDKNNITEITIGYLDETLIYLQYHNPLTPGYTEQQKREYFYRYSFTPDKSYGNPGLEFIDINVQAIDKQLHEGLKGKEIQYFKNGQLIKSKIFIYFNDNDESYPTTIHFEKRSFWKKLATLLDYQYGDSQLSIKEIDLRTIFNRLD